MTIKSPCAIAPNLEPGVAIGDAWVTVDYSPRPGRESRVRFRCTILLPGGGEYTDEELQSGSCGVGASLREGLASFLCFLSAAAESVAYCECTRREPDGDDNASLFPAHIVEWARQHSDEITLAQLELEETPDCIIE